MKKRTYPFLAIFFSLCFSQMVFAQEVVVDKYIQEAFQNNLVIQQKNLSIEKALYTLRSAKTMYFPNLALQGGYQTGEGGRSISIPVDEIIAPIYATLNKALQIPVTDPVAGKTSRNFESYFLPKNFYDVKMVATMPIYNKEISINKQIQEQQYDLQKNDLATYKRELVAQVKTAYFTYLNSLGAVDIYKNAMIRAQETKKITEKLIANGKGLPAHLVRSESEVYSTQSLIVEAEKQSNLAKMYFNFLLNVDLQRDINHQPNQADLEKFARKSLASEPALERREELRLLKGLESINQSALKLSQSVWLPKVNGFVNLGSQSTNWDLNSKSAYYFLGLQMDLPIYSGKRNNMKISQAEIDVKLSQNKLEQASHQLNLAAESAKKTLQSDVVKFTSAEKQLESASTYYHLIQKGFAEGVNSYIETIEARTHCLIAQTQLNNARLKVLISATNYEREIAAYSMP
ncbi:TolC family protein [Aquirufa sp. ROCK2-A2]